MLNYIWLALVLLAVAIGGWNDRLKDVTGGALDGAKTAVTIAIGLWGVMALWLGVMRLAERAGLVQRIAYGLRPLMLRLFPEVPPEHPAMGSMLMNMAANMLGLGNAATPLGLRAMRDLESLNPRPGIASNAMCTFLAINTSSVQLIPATAIAILAAAGSARPTVIVGTAFFATLCAATVAVLSAKFFERLSFFRPRREIAAVGTDSPHGAGPSQRGAKRMAPEWHPEGAPREAAAGRHTPWSGSDVDEGGQRGVNVHGPRIAPNGTRIGHPVRARYRRQTGCHQRLYVGAGDENRTRVLSLGS